MRKHVNAEYVNTKLTFRSLKVYWNGVLSGLLFFLYKKSTNSDDILAYSSFGVSKAQIIEYKLKGPRI